MFDRKHVSFVVVPYMGSFQYVVLVFVVYRWPKSVELIGCLVQHLFSYAQGTGMCAERGFVWGHGDLFPLLTAATFPSIVSSSEAFPIQRDVFCCCFSCL